MTVKERKKQKIDTADGEFWGQEGVEDYSRIRRGGWGSTGMWVGSNCLKSDVKFCLI